MVSVPANIAESFRKRGVADTARFLNVSQGSLAEVEYYLILARDLEYITQREYDKLMDSLTEVNKLLESYASKILNSNS